MIHLLLIDDNPLDRQLALRELKREFSELQVQEIASEEDLDRALDRGAFDAAITDYQLRWNDGITVLRRLKAAYPDRPVIMFTNSGSQEVAVEAMKLGLDDYVLKSLNHAVRLPTALRLALDHAQANRKAVGLETRLQTLLNQLEVGVYRLQSDGVFLEGNRAFLRLLGLSENVDLSQSIAPFFKPQDYAQLIEQLGHQSDEREELQICCADNTTRWIKLSKAMINVKDITIVDGLIEDISDRKRIELENQRLYKEAQQANRLKDEFLSIVSHELRTPLNAILGWSSTLRQRLLTPEILIKAATVIERNAKRQSQLINDILDVSLIVQNRLRLDRTLVDFALIVETAIQDFQIEVDAKGICVESKIDPTVERISGDATRLHQIVWNLLSNAIKFTPSGGTITIKLGQINNQIQLRVSDTGEGISPEFLPHLFDRFRQADASITRKQGGLGLGLSIVRYFVEQQDGVIVAESDGVGRGATFTVSFPIAPVDLESSSQQTSTEPLPSLQGLRILVVEDDADNRELICFVLERAGAQVTIADSAKDALAKFAQANPDVILCDIGLSDTDGYTLIQELKKLGNQSIPAIALTAFARDEDRQFALQAGFDAHTTKPINPVELVSIVAKSSGRN